MPKGKTKTSYISSALLHLTTPYPNLLALCRFLHHIISECIPVAHQGAVVHTSDKKKEKIMLTLPYPDIIIPCFETL